MFSRNQYTPLLRQPQLSISPARIEMPIEIEDSLTPKDCVISHSMIHSPQVLADCKSRRVTLPSLDMSDNDRLGQDYTSTHYIDRSLHLSKEQKVHKYSTELNILIDSGWLPIRGLENLPEQKYLLLNSQQMQLYIAQGKITFSAFTAVGISDHYSALLLINSNYCKAKLSQVSSDENQTSLDKILYLSNYFILEDYQDYWHRNKLRGHVECDAELIEQLLGICFIQEKHLKVLCSINDAELLQDILNSHEDCVSSPDFSLSPRARFYNALKHKKIFDAIYLEEVTINDIISVVFRRNFFLSVNLDNHFINLAMRSKELSFKEAIAIENDLAKILPTDDSFLYNLYNNYNLTIFAVIWVANNNPEKIKAPETHEIQENMRNGKLNYIIFLGLKRPSLIATDFIGHCLEQMMQSVQKNESALRQEIITCYTNISSYLLDEMLRAKARIMLHEQTIRELFTTMYSRQAHASQILCLTTPGECRAKIKKDTHAGFLGNAHAERS